jgi:hypothetical protein
MPYQKKTSKKHSQQQALTHNTASKNELPEELQCKHIKQTAKKIILSISFSKLCVIVKANLFLSEGVISYLP